MEILSIKKWVESVSGNGHGYGDRFGYGIDLNSDMFTVEEFAKLCETNYGCEIIRKLMEDCENK